MVVFLPNDILKQLEKWKKKVEEKPATKIMLKHKLD